jgi:hypothetical protein
MGLIAELCVNVAKTDSEKKVIMSIKDLSGVMYQ